MAFTIGEKVVAQLTGGQSGTKGISPMLTGNVESINGSKVTVIFNGHNAPIAETFFPGRIVDEQFLLHA